MASRLLLLTLFSQACLTNVVRSSSTPLWTETAPGHILAGRHDIGRHGSYGQRPLGPVEAKVQRPLSEKGLSLAPTLILLNQSVNFHEFINAVETMQNKFFELWLGGWPEGSDWTRAVFGTYLSGALHSLTMSAEYWMHEGFAEQREDELDPSTVENTINKYFSQVTTYYWNEDILAIRTQAHDDMLWVVLGWLESIKFMNLHDTRHHNTTGGLETLDTTTTWHGKQFEAVFAHRAHVLYDVAYKAWDTTLCGGGLTWDPKLATYKNTVTNTQYISASIGMYLYHPGDDNQMPFMKHTTDGFGLPKIGPHEKKFLDAAIEAYQWLVSVNMTNANGLYVDGYHISGENSTLCDDRNEMVYTYNQGILLSGLRGLWEGTGQSKYLEDGHKLVSNVMRATGWQATDGSSFSSSIGRNGIMEEFCDASGACSQDGQNFKGIFFHHLTLFCEPLPTEQALIPGLTFLASKRQAFMHAQSCKSYLPWIRHNAEAALKTRDEHGVFGGWWGASANAEKEMAPDTEALPRVPLSRLTLDDRSGNVEEGRPNAGQGMARNSVLHSRANDANDRGRGRTVETQSCGVALLRALYELSRLYG